MKKLLILVVLAAAIAAAVRYFMGCDDTSVDTLGDDLADAVNKATPIPADAVEHAKEMANA